MLLQTIMFNLVVHFWKFKIQMKRQQLKSHWSLITLEVMQQRKGLPGDAWFCLSKSCLFSFSFHPVSCLILPKISFCLYWNLFPAIQIPASVLTVSSLHKKLWNTFLTLVVPQYSTVLTSDFDHNCDKITSYYYQQKIPVIKK